MQKYGLNLLKKTKYMDSSNLFAKLSNNLKNLVNQYKPGANDPNIDPRIRSQRPTLSRLEMLSQLQIDVDDYKEYVKEKLKRKDGASISLKESVGDRVPEFPSKDKPLPKKVNTPNLPLTSFLNKIADSFFKSKNSNRNGYKYTNEADHVSNCIDCILQGDYVNAGKYLYYAEFVNNRNLNRDSSKVKS